MSTRGVVDNYLYDMLLKAPSVLDYSYKCYEQANDIIYTLRKQIPVKYLYDDTYLIKKVSGQQIKKIHDYIRSLGGEKIKMYPYQIAPTNFRKSSDYRKKYVDMHPPKKGAYRCTYCGRYVYAERMEVDHIISAAQAQTDMPTQKWIEKHGWSGINDIRNLTASCSLCNEYKSDKGGIWVFRGFIRRHSWYWPVRRILSVVVVVALLFLFREQILNILTTMWSDLQAIK